MKHDIKTTYFKGHSAAICCISPNFNEAFPISATKDDVKIWSQQRQDDLRDKNAALVASFNMVSYKWHGIMCWDVVNLTVLWQLPMEECRFAATFRLSSAFKVQDLRSGTVQCLQWKALITTKTKLANQPLYFAHEGFAVAGAANDMKVWDTECGDQLLSLDHGVFDSNLHREVRQIQYFLWATNCPKQSQATICIVGILSADLGYLAKYYGQH
ncbi:hypothetical protein V8E53_011818 [Lactarius tabidus]